MNEMSIQFVLLLGDSMMNERKKKKKKKTKKETWEEEEERISTLPVVSSNEGAPTVFFTPNKRFILERVCVLLLSNTNCWEEVPSEKQEEKNHKGHFLW